MKAEIINNELVIFPESNTEHYAIKHLVSDANIMGVPVVVTVDTELVDSLYD